MDSFAATRGVKPCKIGFTPRNIPRPLPQRCHAAQPKKGNGKSENLNMSQREARNIEEASAPEGEDIKVHLVL